MSKISSPRKEEVLISYVSFPVSGILCFIYVFCLQCFLKVKPKSLTFSQASDTCHTYGGTLPSVLSQREQGNGIIFENMFYSELGAKSVLRGFGELPY